MGETTTVDKQNKNQTTAAEVESNQEFGSMLSAPSYSVTGGEDEGDSHSGFFSDANKGITTDSGIEANNPDFDPETMRDVIKDSSFQGAGSPALRDAMSAIQGSHDDKGIFTPASGEELDAALATIAEVRGLTLEECQQQYEQAMAIKVAGEARNREQNPEGDEEGGVSPTLDTDKHGDFMGSTGQLRFGMIMGDVFGVDPVFGALISPTGGAVGPGNESVSDVDPNNPTAMHGTVHDAAGYLLNAHGVGPGYNYLNDDYELFGTDNPLAGQVSGTAYFADRNQVLNTLGTIGTFLSNIPEHGLSQENVLESSIEAGKGNGITRFLDDPVGTIGSGVSSAWDGIKGLAGDAWDGAKGVASDAWSGAKGLASDAWSGAKGAASSAWEGTKDAAGSAWDTASGWAGDAWSGAKGLASDAWSGTKDAASSAWEGTKDTASSAWDTASSWAGDAWSGAKGLASDAWSGTKDAASSAWDTTSGAAGSAWDTASGWAGDAWDGATGAASSAWEGTKDAAGSAWDSTSSAAGSAWDTASGWAGDAWGGVTDAWDRIPSREQTQHDYGTSPTGNGVSGPSGFWDVNHDTGGVQGGFELGGSISAPGNTTRALYGGLTAGQTPTDSGGTQYGLSANAGVLNNSLSIPEVINSFAPGTVPEGLIAQLDTGLGTASADAWVSDQGMSLGAQANLAEIALTLGTQGQSNQDRTVRGGLSEGVGLAGRLHWGDADGDQLPEYGIGGDFLMFSADIKTEDPVRDLIGASIPGANLLLDGLLPSTNMTQNTKEAVSAGADAAAEWAGDAWDATSSAAGSAWDSTTSAVSSTANAAQEVVSNAWSTTTSTASNAASAVGGLASDAWDGASNMASSAASSVGNAASSAASTVGNAASSAWDGASSMASSAGSSIGSAWDSLWD